MFEVVARDGWGRITRWEIPQGPVETPLVLHVHTERFPAPPSAPVILARRRPPSFRAWIQDLGSRFHPEPKDPEAFLHIEADVPYPPFLSDAKKEAESESPSEGEVGVLTPEETPRTDSPLQALSSASVLLRNSWLFASAITRLRSRLGASRLLYAPGCALPHELALLVYAGVDLFDDASARLWARQGYYLTPEGPIPSKDLEGVSQLPCSCFSCSSGRLDPEGLESHALWALDREIRTIQVAIRRGTLRDLVEMRSRADPTLVAHLRRFDREHYSHFEPRTPLVRSSPLLATSKESLERPEVERFRRRIETRYRKPESAQILLLLPCSARKPYSLSRTHRLIHSVLNSFSHRSVIHEVIVTSPLGIVPRELERIYPASQYDVPVTGVWDEEEKTLIRGTLSALIQKNRYHRIVVHLNETETEIVAPVLGEYDSTGGKDPLDPSSLETLRRTLEEVTKGLPKVPWDLRLSDDISSLASWQMGEAGRAITEGSRVLGRPPYVRVFDGSTQLAMTTERGLLSLTLEGGSRLLSQGAYLVEIEDFVPRGTLFAVGVVRADSRIVPQDEVVLHHKGELRGVGRALVCGSEMEELERGGVVQVRHHVREGLAG